MTSALERPGGPSPVRPGHFVLTDEARKARRRLLPTTLFYPTHFAVVLAFALRTGDYERIAAFVGFGFCSWTLIEYLVHRYILHGRFPDGPGIKHLLHRQFDHLHLAHHERPWDGNHVSGTLKDTLPPATILMAISIVAGPISTWPIFMATILLGYVMEEWVHHSVHFCNFKSRYFRYIKKHHLYHHSARGSEVGYGLTSGIWDLIVGTRIEARDRLRLFGRPITH